MDESRTRPVLTIVGILFLALAVSLATWYLRGRNIGPDQPLPDIGAGEFADFLGSGKPGIIEFYTDTCQWCALLEPELAEVRAKYGGKLLVAKMNAQNHYTLATRYSVRVVPTMIFFNRSGNVQSTIEGFMEAGDIVKLIESMGIAR